MIQELFQLYADRWQFFLKLTLQHLEISLIAIVAALCIGLSLGILISRYRYHRHRPGDHRSRPRDGKYPVSDSL